MGTHRLGEFIIDVVGQRTGRIGIERIETHRGEREHLEIDPRLVHVGDPAGTDVEEFGLQFRKLRGSSPVVRSGCSEEGFRNEVFFKRDGAHGGLDAARAAGVSSMWNEAGGAGYQGGFWNADSGRIVPLIIAPTTAAVSPAQPHGERRPEHPWLVS
jgi:hypothetical protein